ncbi:chemotaxis protein CheA [Tritonibacter scottomollicae]|uniref:chemotaxis protein CheA n=1 Tax=Tritonibacter scottomollicae TaxID=483013 RepID=UPI003BAD080B
MYHFTTPPMGLMVTLPGAIASANGPHAAALSLSDSESLTTNQLQNHVSQARRAREKLIDQVSKPPEPGWRSAMNQISDTVDQMEKVLSFLRSQSADLPAKPVEDMDALAVFPSGTAMQQSGSMPDSRPSEAESPTAATTASDASSASAPRVIYVMDDGVIIVGRPPQDTAAPARNGADATGFDRSSPVQTRPSGDHMTSNAVISLPLTEDQQRASAELIALAQKAYAQQQASRDAQGAALFSDESVGLTGALSDATAAVQTSTRGDRAPVPRMVMSDPAERPNVGPATDPASSLTAAPKPFERDPAREAAAAAEQQQIMALQLDGHSDIIYIVPPAKAAMDLTA